MLSETAKVEALDEVSGLPVESETLFGVRITVHSS